MNFSQLFTNRTIVPDFKPTNRLENLLDEAYQNQARRPEFMHDIFLYELIVIGKLRDRGRDLHAPTLYSSETENGSLVYAFTSEKALQYYLMKGNLPAQPYVTLTTRQLFEAIRGKHGFVLNMGHRSTLVFTKDDVLHWAEPALLQNEVLEKDLEMHIGKPSRVPDNLLLNLGEFKHFNGKLKMIYFGLMAYVDGKQEYLVLIDYLDSHAVHEEEKHRIRIDINSILKSSFEHEIPVAFFDLAEGSVFNEPIKRHALYSA